CVCAHPYLLPPTPLVRLPPHPPLPPLPTRRSSDLPPPPRRSRPQRPRPHRGAFFRRQKRTLSKTTFLFSLFCGILFSKARVLLRSEEHTSELQSRFELVCLLLLEKKKITDTTRR